MISVVLTCIERLCESKVVTLNSITNSVNLPFFHLHVYAIRHLKSLFFGYSVEFEIAGFILVQNTMFMLTLGLVVTVISYWGFVEIKEV